MTAEDKNNKRFRRAHEFPRQEKAPHDFPAQQGQSKGRKKDLAPSPITSDVTFIRKTADTTIDTDSTLSDDTHLVRSVPKDAWFTFRANLFATSTSSTPDIKAAFTFPSGAACFWQGISTTSDFSAFGGAWQNDGTTPGSYDGYFPITANKVTLIQISGWLKTVGSGGTFGLQWAQNASNATSITLTAQSWLEITRVKPDA